MQYLIIIQHGTYHIKHLGVKYEIYPSYCPCGKMYKEQINKNKILDNIETYV